MPIYDWVCTDDGCAGKAETVCSISAYEELKASLPLCSVCGKPMRRKITRVAFSLVAFPSGVEIE